MSDNHSYDAGYKKGLSEGEQRGRDGAIREAAEKHINHHACDNNLHSDCDFCTTDESLRKLMQENFEETKKEAYEKGRAEGIDDVEKELRMMGYKNRSAICNISSNDVYSAIAVARRKSP